MLALTVLKTERLVLRKLSTDDAEFILQLLNEPSFLRYIGDKGVRTLDEAQQYIVTGPVASYEEYGFGLYMVELKETGAKVGISGLVKRPALDHPDIGFAFLPSAWSKGYAAESAAAVMAYAKDVLGLGCILAITTLDNHSSINVLRKIGMTSRGTIRLSEDGDELRLYAADNRFRAENCQDRRP